MPITDNSFTPEEFSAAIEAKPELLNHVTGVLSAKKYAIRSEQDEQTYRKNIEDSAIGSYTSKVATEVEKTMKELTGIDKLPNEKWTDYYQRATKDVVGGKKQFENELTELRGKSNLTEAERNMLNDLKAANQKLQLDTESMKSSYEVQLKKLKASTSIQAEISAIRAQFKKTPELQKAIDIVSNQTLKEMADMSDIDQYGKVVFVKDGNFIKDANGTPKTAAQIYSDAMADYIDKGRQQSGAGGDGGSGGGSTQVPPGVKTQVDLTRYINSLGIISGSKQYSEMFAKMEGNKLPLR